MERVEPNFSANPYAAPRAPVADVVEGTGCWREKKRVLLKRNADFPARCVKCNSTVAGKVKTRKLYWHHPGWYVLVVLWIWVYLIAALIVRKKVQVSPALCATHRNLRLTKIGLSLLAFLVGGVLVVTQVELNASAGVLTGVVLILVSVVLLMYASRIVTAVHITNEFAEFKGFGPAFLDSLPAAGDNG